MQHPLHFHLCSSSHCVKARSFFFSSFSGFFMQLAAVVYCVCSNRLLIPRCWNLWNDSVFFFFCNVTLTPSGITRHEMRTKKAHNSQTEGEEPNAWGSSFPHPFHFAPAPPPHTTPSSLRPFHHIINCTFLLPQQEPVQEKNKFWGGIFVPFLSDYRAYFCAPFLPKAVLLNDEIKH